MKSPLTENYEEMATMTLSHSAFAQEVWRRFVKAASLRSGSVRLLQCRPDRLPQVHLDADGLAPRPIEELTGTTIARYYALAWRDLAGALDSEQRSRTRRRVRRIRKRSA